MRTLMHTTPMQLIMHMPRTPMPQLTTIMLTLLIWRRPPRLQLEHMPMPTVLIPTTLILRIRTRRRPRLQLQPPQQRPHQLRPILRVGVMEMSAMQSREQQPADLMETVQQPHRRLLVRMHSTRSSTTTSTTTTTGTAHHHRRHRLGTLAVLLHTLVHRNLLRLHRRTGQRTLPPLLRQEQQQLQRQDLPRVTIVMLIMVAQKKLRSRRTITWQWVKTGPTLLTVRQQVMTKRRAQVLALVLAVEALP
mmetsp:Transcript_4334/g.10838  ORF Transcript_4334/g.10838 Transcript_4334/m.10838 type:complete len:248 (+) Transcript_4334:1017-1760(+)